MRKLHVEKITTLIRQDSAVGHFRLRQPLYTMKRLGLIEEAKSTFFSGAHIYGENSQGNLVFDEKMLADICKDADIIWSNFTNNKEDIRRMLDIREWTRGKLIIDIDDNIYAASVDNPGNKAKDWIKELELSMRIADGLTVSVPSLKTLYSQLNKNIYVKPNGMDFKMWKFKVKPHKGIRIGWEGAYGHRDDLELVYPAIKELIKKYKVKFVIMGANVKAGLKPPDFEVEHHDWVGFADYPKKLASLRLDIGLSPLIDSSYNRCKSNLRILDNSMFMIPIVASPVENLKGMPCLYASSNYEWYEQIEKLILSKELREKQGLEQYEFVKNNFSETDLVKPLYEWMDYLERRTDLDPK